MPGTINRWHWPRRVKPDDRAFATAMERLEVAMNEIACRRGSRTVSATYTVQPTDYAIRADASGGAFTVTLPDAKTVLGQIFVVKRLNSGANAVTVAAAGGLLIDGAATSALATQYASLGFQAFQNGTVFGYDVLPVFVAGGGGGEANTASNVGTAGLGFYDGKVGVDLQFRKLNTGAPFTLTLDAPNQHLDLNLTAGYLATHMGSGTLDFGVFPGGSDASLIITGQTPIVAGSKLWVALAPLTTADHSPDEHVVDGPHVYAGALVVGTGFTIFGVSRNEGALTYGQWNVTWGWA